jgi:hypothetical protein
MEPGFNIPLSANTSNLEKDMNKAAQVTDRSSKLMAQSVSVVNAKQNQLNATLSAQLKNLSDLSARYGENSKQALAMATAAERTRQSLSKMLPPNIGGVTQKAASGFNGLGNSINQITREMPAFVNSAQTGFMAISNNLPIFFDQVAMIKSKNLELAAAGLPVQSTMAQIGASFFTWGTALSLSVTALTVLGPKLVNLVMNLGKVNEETKIYIKFSTEQTDAINSQIKALTERNRLLGISITAAQQGISVDQATLNNETDKLNAFKAVNHELAKNVDLRKRGIINEQGQQVGQGFSGDLKKRIEAAQSQVYLASRQAEIDQDNLKIYQGKVDAQKKLVDSMKQELNLQRKLNEIKKKPAENIRTTDVDYLKSVREKESGYIKEFTLLGKNSGLNFAVGFAAAKPLELAFPEKEIYKQSLDIGRVIGQSLTNGISTAIQSGAATVGQAIGMMFAGQNAASTFFDGLIGMVTSFMSALGSAMIAAGVASDIFKKTLLISPYASIAAGLGLIAAAGVVRGIMTKGPAGNRGGAQSQGGSDYNAGWQNLPHMAEGGLLYGRTAFVGGEYAGASNNPEVVAPLNKLKSIIGGGGGGGMLETQLSGRTIRLALMREDKFRRQNYGR